MGFFSRVQGKSLFLVGIKGTGMSSLALLLSASGAKVSGSDVSQRFATDAVLEHAGISWTEGFCAASLPPDTDILIHSAAYAAQSNPQIAAALDRGIPVYSYPQWLAEMSGSLHAYAVAGTHGKTTSAGCLDWILRSTGLPYLAVYGSHIQHETATPRITGDSYAVFEACEYRDHFLSYDLEGVLITTIEHDHPDWFADGEAVLSSFKTLVSRLPAGASVVCGIDSELSARLADWVGESRPDLVLISYGVNPKSSFRIAQHTDDLFESSYRLLPLEGYHHLRLASLALCLDVVGASLLGAAMILRDLGKQVSAATLTSDPILGAMLVQAATFPGCAGRVEYLFEEHGISFYDDYAHHPTEIRTSLEYLRSRYPDSRILTIFFPHTVSRTNAFFDGFVQSLSNADLLLVRPVFASARSDGADHEINGVAERIAVAAGGRFVADETALADIAAHLLHPQDVCVTMGAGNNSGLARAIADRIRSITC